jgi:hypothetical protein
MEDERRCARWKKYSDLKNRYGIVIRKPAVKGSFEGPWRVER